MKSKILQNPLFITLISGVIGIATGGLSSFWGLRIQINLLKEENRILRLEKNLNETETLSFEFFELMNNRFYSMQRVYWALEAYKHEEADYCYADYQVLKNEWNQRVHQIQEKYTFLGNQKMADLVIDRKDARDYREETKSVHAAFVRAHYDLRDFYRGKDYQEEKRRSLELQALESLKNLSEWIKHFKRACSEDFKQRDQDFVDQLSYNKATDCEVQRCKLRG